MNIEGSEYQLMKHIIETTFIKNIDHIQIQFHNYVDGSKKLRNQIRKELKKTHKVLELGTGSGYQTSILAK